MAAIAHVFTISYVANLLGEDEDWLFELSTDMFPEDGCLWVYGVAARTASPPSPKMGLRTCARSSPNNALLDANHPRSNPPNSATCGAYRMLTLLLAEPSLAHRPSPLDGS